MDENLNYSTCLYDLSQLQDNESALIKWDLKKYPEFRADLSECPGLPFNNIFKYIVLCYDRNSPLRDGRTIMSRKVEAAIRAGFIAIDNKFEEDVENLVRCEYQPINSMIIRYCRMQHSIKYSKLVLYEESFYKEQNNYNTEDDASKRKVILALIDDLESKIDVLTSDILAEDNSLLIKRSLLAYIENETIVPTPEVIVSKLKENKDPLDGYNPYKDDEIEWTPNG